MRLPRMTTRRWIDVALVVVMVCLATLLLVQRSQRFAYLARAHAEVAARPPFDHVDRLGPKPDFKRLILWGKEVGAWHEEMARNYQYAARNPWLPVKSIPPPPPMPE